MSEKPEDPTAVLAENFTDALPVDASETVYFQEVQPEDNSQRIGFTYDELSRVFEEWMRRYTDAPDEYQREFEAVRDFDQDPKSYGQRQTEYLLYLRTEMAKG